ncbi:TPA: NAD(P)-dependent oxidoreductase [Candidatus Latescibacteria bacterium]|nr:NAD(P)-dependent oxidoreductase [Candidatus Latescibacterota bacterium]
MPERKRLLITGAAGKVGGALRKHLAYRYDTRLLLNRTIPDDIKPEEEMVIGDISNFEAMLEATQGVDIVAHCAIFNRTRGMTRAALAQLTFDVDMKSCYNIYEACRINGVETVVFASTNHVTGLNEKDGLISRPELPVRPDGIYGAGKAFAEALGRYYADTHGLRVFCLRIANFNGLDEPGRRYEAGQARWLSPRDCAQLTWRCIENEKLKFGIYYGVSQGGEEKWDLTNAVEELGYAPEDNGALPEWQVKY